VAQTSGLVLTDPTNESTWHYTIAPTDEGRYFSTKTIPWEPSMPTTPWVQQLFPFDAGAARTKDLNPRGLSLQPQNPADTFLPEFVVPGPATTALSFTNATQQVLKFIYAKDSSGFALFGICGRYLIRVDAITKAVTSQDLGSSRVASDLVQINGDIIICFSSSHPIQRRSAAGALTASTKYAKSIVVVRNQIWSIGASGTAVNNNLSYILALGDATAANLLDTSLWTTNSPPYVVGDTSYQCYQLYDVAGTLGGCRPDGLYMPDPETKFLNVTPSIQRVPDASGFTGYGCFYALGEFWVPWQRGLLRVSPGNAVDEGPGTAYLPHVGLRVRGGLEWDRMMYILCTDERDSSTYVFKMIPDRGDIADGQFIFQPVAYVAANTTHFGRAIGMASPSTTNPWLVYGGGSTATAASYILLGRGAGRDVDDACFPADTRVSLESFNPIAVSKRWYSGEIAEVTTSGGHKLSGTPNHPVMTDKGWIALGQLKEGDHVVYDATLGQWEFLGNPDIDDRNPMIGEVVAGTASVRGTPNPSEQDIRTRRKKSNPDGFSQEFLDELLNQPSLVVP